MPIFAVKQSEFPNVATPHAFSREPKTVDLGVTLDFIKRAHQSSADIFVVSKGLDSDVAIDGAIDQEIERLNQVRVEAKQLLGSLKR